MAVDMIGDALAGGGGVYASDEDPELVFEALPFGPKTYESLLETSPEHRGRRSSPVAGRSGLGSHCRPIRRLTVTGKCSQQLPFLSGIVQVIGLG